MTADHEPEQIATVAAAIEQGMQTAETYWKAAEANPGVGMEVPLPSYPDPAIGRPVQGLGYPAGAEPAPAPGNPKLKLTPDYASPIVGGELHHGAPAGSPAARAQWPAGTTVSIMPGARSSVVYAPASSRQTWVSRLREAIDALLGRS
jgi:hypothetical protein